jgi:hypothetical protein
MKSTKPVNEISDTPAWKLLKVLLCASLFALILVNCGGGFQDDSANASSEDESIFNVRQSDSISTGN